MMLIAKVDKMRQKREKANLTQHKLSMLAGLGGNAVFRMENENHKVHPLRAKAVADALGCKVEDLFEEPEKAS